MNQRSFARFKGAAIIFLIIGAGAVLVAWITKDSTNPIGSAVSTRSGVNPSILSKLDEVETSLKSAQKQLNTLEDDLYARDPRTKEIAAQYRAVNDRFSSELQKTGNQVSAYLEKEKKRRDNDSAREEFVSLSAYWEERRKDEIIIDPAKTDVPRAIFTSASAKGFRQMHFDELKRLNPSMDESVLDDPQGFWAIFVPYKKKSLELVNAAATRRSAKSDLPEFVLNWARDSGNYRAETEMDQAYLDIKIPNDIKTTRKHVQDLTDELNELTNSLKPKL